MTEYFKVLSDAEYEQLKDAIAIITVYIAGADGVIAEDEIQWAEKVANIRSYNLPGELRSFYDDVGVDFAERVQGYRAALDTIEKRNLMAEAKLSALNPILAKLHPRMGSALYHSYKSFATHVAKASGGFLGFFSIGPKEAALLDLDMLTPVEFHPEEEDSL